MSAAVLAPSRVRGRLGFVYAECSFRPDPDEVVTVAVRGIFVAESEGEFVRRADTFALVDDAHPDPQLVVDGRVFDCQICRYNGEPCWVGRSTPGAGGGSIFKSFDGSWIYTPGSILVEPHFETDLDGSTTGDGWWELTAGIPTFHNRTVSVATARGTLAADAGATAPTIVWRWPRWARMAGQTSEPPYGGYEPADDPDEELPRCSILLGTPLYGNSANRPEWAFHEADRELVNTVNGSVCRLSDGVWILGTWGSGTWWQSDVAPDPPQSFLLQAFRREGSNVVRVAASDFRLVFAGCAPNLRRAPALVAEAAVWRDLQ